MNGRVFLDTNIIIYLYSADEDVKRSLAHNIIDDNFCVTSIQVFNEACNTWHRKFKFNKQQVIKYLDEVESVCDELVLIQRKTINHALNIKERYGYSYYDCLMLASALESDCGVIFTEDMSDGQVIEGSLEIRNPFGTMKR